MENEEHISLDPDVVENSFDSRIPLSSLYGFSAFSEAAEEEAAERDAAKKKNLEQIGRKIFFVTENRESEKLEQLHSRVFQIMPEFQMTEGAGMPEEEREFSGILLITAFMTAAILLLLFLREAEKKGGRGYDAYDRGRGQRTGYHCEEGAEDPGGL